MSDTPELPKLPDWAEEMLPKPGHGEMQVTGPESPPGESVRAKPTPQVRAENETESGTTRPPNRPPTRSESNTTESIADESGTRTGAIPIMDRVNSTNIEAVGHDGSALYVRFHGGALYRYRTAGADLHAALLASASPGKLFHRNVKPNHKGERMP